MKHRLPMSRFDERGVQSRTCCSSARRNSRAHDAGSGDASAAWQVLACGGARWFGPSTFRRGQRCTRLHHNAARGRAVCNDNRAPRITTRAMSLRNSPLSNHSRRAARDDQGRVVLAGRGSDRSYGPTVIICPGSVGLFTMNVADTLSQESPVGQEASPDFRVGTSSRTVIVGRDFRPPLSTLLV